MWAWLWHTLTSAWLWQTIASSAVAGVIAFFGFVFLIPTTIGNKTIGLLFDKKLETFKGEQNEKLAKLQESLSHLTDRGKLSNAREYEATTVAWGSYVEARFATLRSAYNYQEFPDLNRLSGDDLNEFLKSATLSEREINDVKIAADKVAQFSRIMHLRSINDAGNALHIVRKNMIKQGVFIEKNLHDLFETNIKRLTAAWAEERVYFGLKATEKRVERDSLIINDDAWLEELKAKVRDRLLRSTEQGG